jgi:hypothetical protein
MSAIYQIKIAAFNTVLNNFGLAKLADDPTFTDHVMNFISPAVEAKNHYLADPIRRAAEHVGHGVLNPIAAINDLRAAPRQLNLKNVGNLAGLATLGYGAYRGGKALVHKLTAPKYDEHH